MSRALFNSCRIAARQYKTPQRASFYTSAQCLNQQANNQQQNSGKTTHFGFRDVAEEDKESLGKI